METVDAKGQLCPAPLILTKRQLRKTTEGDSFILIIDNNISFANVSRFLKDNEIQFSVSEKDNIWTLTVTKTKAELLKQDAEEFCIPHFRKGDFVVAISSDKMGDGDPELGTLLMINFIKAICDLDILPSKIVFYNRGVFLGKKDSQVFEQLKDLEQMGVSIYICGTCINHYSLGAEISVGVISNMFEIAQILASANKVIKP